MQEYNQKVGKTSSRKRPLDNWTSIAVNKFGEQKVHVPWLHRFELQVVVDDIYSTELERQKRGYGKLLLWKARFPRLPVGIECTMGLLRVHLINQDVSRQVEKGEKCIYAEHDLQLMFSSALTRCINQLSFVSQGDTKVLSSLEDKLNIPRWIINLRHEASHRTVLPSLSKLVLGIRFLLEWLHTNYWKETSSFPGWIVSKSTQPLVMKSTFKLLFDVWQSMKLFEVTGYKYLPECDRSGAIQETITQQLGIKLENESVSEAVQCLTKTLVKELEDHCDASGCNNFQRLYSILLESDTFIPSEEVLNLAISFEKDEGVNGEKDKHTGILKWMRNFWSCILQCLQNKYSLFPGLIHRLLQLLSCEKSSHRQLIIALWIKVICISMEMSTANFSLDNSPTCKTKTNKEVHFEERNQLLLNNKKDDYVTQGGFTCEPKNPEGNYCSQDILMFAVLNPTENTLLFLPNLLKVARPLVKTATQSLLKELVSIYCGKGASKKGLPVNHHIYTIDELTGEDKSYPEIEELDLSFWGRASKQEWASCPLGFLPWQKGSLATLDFPVNVTWESKGESHYDHSEFNDFNFRKILDDNEMSLIQDSVSLKKPKRLKGKKKIPRW